jgi:uncharacterized membrane protein
VELLMVRFENVALARAGLAALRASAGADGLEPGDLALVFVAADHRLRIEQTHGATSVRGAARGALLGIVLTMVTSGVPVGAGPSAAPARRRPRGVDDKLLRRIVQVIEESEAVVFVAADAESVDRIAEHIDEERRRRAGYVVLSPADEAVLLDAAD